MRFTLEMLGHTLHFGPTETETESEFETYQDAGTTTSTTVGFTASVMPEWEAPPGYHQFDPEPDSEDRR